MNTINQSSNATPEEKKAQMRRELADCQAHKARLAAAKAKRERRVNRLRATTHFNEGVMMGDLGLCPQKMTWEQRYSDDSGVQYAVRYDAMDGHYDGCAKIQIAAVYSADFPVTQLDWLIACLCKIREELGHNT